MKPFLILVSLLIAAGSVLAEGQATAPGRTVPTKTLGVKIFSDLENEWLDAVHKRDREALNKIVAPRFELRSAAAPGTPTPREESLDQSLQLAPFQSSIGQMAVHEYGDVMVVSFLWKIDAAKQTALPRSVFVVDTWKRNQDSWQVVARYVAPVVEGAANVPGAMLPTGQAIEKKI
jgi:ketosteroid isomerase-like protein